MKPRGFISQIFIAVVLVAGFLAYNLYAMQATVDLRNGTRFVARFYINQRLVCTARPGEYCHKIIYTGFFAQTLTAVVNTGVEKFTPPHTFYRQSGSYQYLACGELANPGRNCGLFEGSEEPRTF